MTVSSHMRSVMWPANKEGEAMTRMEFICKMTEVILSDWRKVMLANATSREQFNLPKTTVDISWRAMQKAEEMAKQYDGQFREE